MRLREKALEQKQERADEKQARSERDARPEQQWEYLARNMTRVVGPQVEGNFNGLGEKGWEFVAMVQGGPDGYAVFKRRKH